MKSNFTVVKDGYAFTSQHIGELGLRKSEEFYRETLDKFCRWLDCKPSVIVSDLHPDYFSTRIADSLEGERVTVQHHYAHALSVVAEHRLFARNLFPMLAVVYDGYGYGIDGTGWGGELFLFDLKGFKRVASLAPFKPLGGIQLPLKPSLSALSFILSAGLEPSSNLVKRQKEFQKHFQFVKTRSTSIGRLFDAVAAMLNVCLENTYQGEAPQKLEALVDPRSIEGLDSPFKFTITEDTKRGMLNIDWRECIAKLLQENDPRVFATHFHNQLVKVTVELVKRLRQKYEFGSVAISGGAFQNNYLLDGINEGLTHEGFQVYYNRLFPANDGGISLGQALYGVYSLEKNRR